MIVNIDNIAGNEKTEKRTLKWYVHKQGFIQAILISGRGHKKLILVIEFSNRDFLLNNIVENLLFKIN